MTDQEQAICPLCGAPMDPSVVDSHHLVPDAKGGKETVDIHRACHRHLHALFTNNELRDFYGTVDALKAHPDVLKFSKWVSKEFQRNPTYVGTSRESKKRKGR